MDSKEEIYGFDWRVWGERGAYRLRVGPESSHAWAVSAYALEQIADFLMRTACEIRDLEGGDA